MSRRIKNLNLVINDKPLRVKPKKSSKLISKKVIIQQKTEVKEIIKENKCKNGVILLLVYLLIIPYLLMLLYVFISNGFRNKYVFKYKDYYSGDKVNYKNIDWYVIINSNSYNDTLLLLSSKLMDINNDGVINTNDKIEFNKINVRILRSNEYVLMRNTMKLGYFWSKDNILAGSNMHDWWIKSNNDLLYSVTKNGCFKINNIDDVNYIRPVVKVKKIDLKK